MFSLVIAAMGAAFIFFLLVRGELTPKNRMAVTLSAIVVAIAAYHYFRIFDSWQSAFALEGDTYVQVAPFNEGYRYVDWLLTVPLLLAELVLVLRLSSSATRNLLLKLIPAAIAMILLGWPGEVSPADSLARNVWGLLSTVPFLYILYVLFVELGRSLGRQPTAVRKWVDGMRYVILATWGVYPIAYLLPTLLNDEATAEVARQVGYSIADILAKPVFGLMIVAVAFIKSREDRAALEHGGNGAGAHEADAVPVPSSS